MPRYVHALAAVVGLSAGVILWRTGGLHAGVIGTAIKLLIAPGAIYYFFVQQQRGSADTPGSEATRGPKGGDGRDRS